MSVAADLLTTSYVLSDPVVLDALATAMAEIAQLRRVTEEGLT